MLVQLQKPPKLKKMRIAVFPGSFDPITIGHYDIVKRALPLFDKIIVAIGQNSNKKYLFSLEKRLELLTELFQDEPKVERNAYSGLTADYCRTENAKYLLRGLRSSADFEYEKTIAQLNKDLHPDLETVFFVSAPQYTHISSTIVREIIINNGDATQFLPEKLRNLIA